MPLSAPAMISKLCGDWPITAKIAVQTAMNKTVNHWRFSTDVVDRVTNAIEAHEQPITDVNAAAPSAMPNRLSPTAPAAALEASAAMLLPLRCTPLATTPKMAKKSNARMTPVMRMLMIELDVM